MQLHVQPFLQTSRSWKLDKLDTEESPRIGWEAPAEYLQVQEVQLCTVFVFASNKAAVLEDLEGMIKHLDYSRISRKVNLCQGPLFRGNGPA
jgi:hypothetical protein